MQINGTNGAMLISTTLSFIGVGASEGDYGIYVLPPDHILIFLLDTLVKLID